MSDLSEYKREEGWHEKGGGGGGEQTEWTDDSWKGGIKLYKTHLFVSTMEKVKAHDRYKDFCYWVEQLLYFDGLESVTSTQVGLFDSMRGRVLHLFYSTVAWLFILWIYNALYIHKTNPPPPPVMNACKYNCRSFGCGTAKCSHWGLCCKGSVLSNESTDFWGHTKGMLGIIIMFFLTSEIKIYTVRFFCVVYWFLPQHTSL